MSTARQRNK